MKLMMGNEELNVCSNRGNLGSVWHMCYNICCKNVKISHTTMWSDCIHNVYRNRVELTIGNKRTAHLCNQFRPDL